MAKKMTYLGPPCGGPRYVKQISRICCTCLNLQGAGPIPVSCGGSAASTGAVATEAPSALPSCGTIPQFGAEPLAAFIGPNAGGNGDGCEDQRFQSNSPLPRTAAARRSATAMTRPTVSMATAKEPDGDGHDRTDKNQGIQNSFPPNMGVVNPINAVCKWARQRSNTGLPAP